MNIGDIIKHPDHKLPVQITQIDGDMIAFTVAFPRGGCFRRWAHRITFTEKASQ